MPYKCSMLLFQQMCAQTVGERARAPSESLLHGVWGRPTSPLSVSHRNPFIIIYYYIISKSRALVNRLEAVFGDFCGRNGGI